MSKYCEITSKSLIDFEEIKFILANNNVNLVSSYEIKEKVFIKNNISLKNSNYHTIIENSLKISKINDKQYLTYTTAEGFIKETTHIEINNEEDCISFLNHIGYKEGFLLETDIYTYSDGNNELDVINLINIGLYVSVKKDNVQFEELKEILNSFHIPYDEECYDESMEKLYINKLRRQLK